MDWVTQPPDRQGWTRRRLLGAAGSGAIAAALPGWLRTANALADNPGSEAASTFVSRPDLSPPTVSVAVPAQGTPPGYIFLGCASGPGQTGPMIIDDQGELVWFQPVAPGTFALNFRVLKYQKRPVIVWWEGQVISGFGYGEYVIADTSYNVLHRVKAANGQQGDLHDFLITKQGTAYFTVAQQIPFDLTPLGGPANGTLIDSVIQEVDIASGRLLFEWHSTDHLSLDETYQPVADGPFDFSHVNSIDVDADGNLLVSARHTWTIYKIDRRSGDIIWRLGGKKNTFKLGPGVQFSWQHHARWQGHGALTLFDNADNGRVHEEPASRGLRLVLDQTAMTAALDKQYPQPNKLLAKAMGSVQPLADGGAMVGWGSASRFSEFAPDGNVRFDAGFTGGGTTYRAFRNRWTGTPKAPPDLAVNALNGVKHAFVSWNGATKVTHWRLLAGTREASLKPVRVVARKGFETSMRLPTGGAFVAVEAVDAKGKTLARSRVVPA